MGLDTSAALVSFATRLAEVRTLDDIERCYLDEVRRIIPLPAAGLYLLDADSDKPWRIATVGVSDFFISRYEQFGRARDPVLAEVIRTHRPVSNRALMSGAKWRALPMYKHVHHLHRMTLSLQAPVLCGSDLVGTLNFGGSDDERLPSEDRIALLDGIGRLVGAAVKSTLARRDQDRRHEQVVAALSLSDEAVAISDMTTGERTLNPAAERLLDRLDERHSDCLDRLLASAETMLPAVRSEHVVLRDGRTSTLRVRVAAPDRWPDVVVCFLHLIDPRPDAIADSIAQWLTDRERAVAECVARGMRDVQIADELHLSAHTVRDHVRNIYRKTGATNRVTLTRLMLLGPGIASASRNGGD